MKEEPLRLRFFYGVADIAAFLRVPEAKVEKMIQAREIPAKKDPMGRLILCNLDVETAKVAPGDKTGP